MEVLNGSGSRWACILAVATAGLGAAAGAASAAPTLVAAGDIACPPGGVATETSCGQAATAALVESLSPTVVATLGDNQYETGATQEFTGGFGLSWGRFKQLIHPTPGNNDYETPGAAGYFTYFGAAAGDPRQGYYSYDIGSWHVIVLNSECSAVPCARGSAQERWLQRDLSRHPTSCTLAYWHHPLFTSGIGGANPNGQDTRAFWHALYAHAADVVLTGHSHNYERFDPQSPDGLAYPARGLRQFVVGTGGRSLTPFDLPAANSAVRDDTTFGVLWMELRPDGYDWRFSAVGGPLFRDAGSASCHHARRASTPPRLSRVSVTLRRFSVGRQPTPVAFAVPGTTFRYRLDEPATVRIELLRALAGRRAGRSCRRPSPRLRRARRCLRLRSVGTLERAAVRGLGETRFSGRVGRRALAVGSYVASISATDPAGNRSGRRLVRFAVVRRERKAGPARRPPLGGPGTRPPMPRRG